MRRRKDVYLRLVPAQLVFQQSYLAPERLYYLVLDLARRGAAYALSYVLRRLLWSSTVCAESPWG